MYMAMGERQMQQRDRAIPQLSCALCRDRKLKCDKLDPCTNCTSSGVTCVPVYRPRLPRGRHARRSRENSSSKSTTPPQSTNRRRNAIDAGTAACMSRPTDPAENPTIGVDPGPRPRSCLERLDTVVQGGDVPKMMDGSLQEAKGDPDVMDRIRRLESLVQKFGSCANSLATTGPGRDCLKYCESSTCNQLPSLAGGSSQLHACACNTLELAAASLPSPSSGEPEPFDSNDHTHRHESGCLAQSRQFFSGLMHGDLRRAEHGTLTRVGAYHEEADLDHVSQENHDRDELRCLNMLGLNNRMSIRTLNPAGSPFKDRASMSQLCKVYLRNVDPVIKILHRPSLSKWMLDGDRYLGYSEDHISIEALESAVCYAAANTLSDAQCRAMFRTSKSTMVSTYRGQCEVAIDRAGLLTTRCRVILQSFVLYLVGRRSEEKGAAVWTLVTLAVRIALAMGLNREPSDREVAESFFHQQMRLRLWLTICLLDLQASVAQSKKPLIGYQDAGAAVSKVRHINDLDFDMSTSKQVPDREELTETTFALVTYRAQVAGRLLNFSKAEDLDELSKSRGETSTQIWSCSASSQQRRKHVSQFQHQVLVLLHFCDPESSPYAWFTWHSTQCLISAMRLSESLSCQLNSDVHAAAPAPIPATTSSSLRSSNTDLLRKSLQTLEKSQLIYSDPRGEGFRWYTITIPQLALSTAITECNTCTDIPLVRRAWPIIEASYQQYESAFFNNTGGTTHSFLSVAMNQAREKLFSRLQACLLSEKSPGPALYGEGTFTTLSYSFPDTSSRSSSRTPTDASLGLDPYLSDFPTSSSQASHVVSTQRFAQNEGDADPLSLEYIPDMEADMCNSNMFQPSASAELLETGWMVGDMMTAYSNWEDDAIVRNSDADGELGGLYHGSNDIGF
ncbi:hypothetical protein E4U43_000899 [Claviceps pusilla]|uniref:Zn(2)-C6 fungal-type domain-containing protein n=1 Tax=Claviceps pusilla TaxID=123648 RepID=A0A9P7N9F4_9HYPO|nr:hypothetical protein E4U43_000899 [Claviceps pusilla]